MFEVNFKENIDIEKDINDSKRKIVKYNKNIASILRNIIFLAISILSFLLVGYNATKIGIILRGISLATAGASIHSFVKNTIKIINNMLDNKNKKLAQQNLESISNVLKNSNVNTNSKELSNSVIIENSYSSTKEINEDGISSFNEETTEDKYFLFLDKNYNTCGMLERNTKITRDDETNSDRKFYVLEKEDIDKIEHKVVKVKKLVKKPNNIEKKC